MIGCRWLVAEFDEGILGIPNSYDEEPKRVKATQLSPGINTISQNNFELVNALFPQTGRFACTIS
jgi:hypothetical protein